MWIVKHTSHRIFWTGNFTSVDIITDNCGALNEDFTRRVGRTRFASSASSSGDSWGESRPSMWKGPRRRLLRRTAPSLPIPSGSVLNWRAAIWYLKELACLSLPMRRMRIGNTYGRSRIWLRPLSGGFVLIFACACEKTAGLSPEFDPLVWMMTLL